MIIIILYDQKLCMGTLRDALYSDVQGLSKLRTEKPVFLMYTQPTRDR